MLKAQQVVIFPAQVTVAVGSRAFSTAMINAAKLLKRGPDPLGTLALLLEPPKYQLGKNYFREGTKAMLRDYFTLMDSIRQ